jgi:hypothetical protein
MRRICLHTSHERLWGPTKGVGDNATHADNAYLKRDSVHGAANQRKLTYPVPHERIVLCTQHTFLTLGISLRNHLRSKVLANIVHNSRRFGQNNLLLGTSRRNGDHWRPLERMHSFQVIASTEVLVASVDLELILEVQLFEQPHCTLAPRLLEPTLWSASLFAGLGLM